jgi:hypothetical protein
MRHIRFLLGGVLAAAAFTIPVACSDSGVTSATSGDGGNGTVVIQLTDAPFLTDSVKSVDLFVVRVDARLNDADSAASDHALSVDSAASNGWKTVATPAASFDLLSLQGGIAATLGQANLAAGSYSGFRLVIDPDKSSVTLKNGTTLTSTTSPNVTFPSAAQSGLKIQLSQPVQVVTGTKTSLLVDFDVNSSFVLRGNSIHNNGLLFKPVIHATVTNTATTNANVRLINATNTALSFLQGGTALAGGSGIAFGTASSCASVNAASPNLSVVQVGSTTALPGFSPSLAVGSSTSFLAYQNATGGVQFVSLGNAFTPTTGQAGLRIFNATTSATGYDVFVTTAGAVLGAATVSNVLAGASSSFTSVPAGAQQIRITSTGGVIVLLDAGSQSFVAGQNYVLVIAAPADGSAAPRAFLVAGC